VLNTPIPADRLGSLANGGAFVGFTAASGDPSTLETVDISNWTVRTAAPSAATTSLDLSPASLVGQLRKDSLQLRDACDAPLPISSPSAAVTAFVNGPLDAATDSPVTIPQSLQDNLDGTFTLSYTPLVAGPHLVFVRFAGLDLNASPYTVTINPRTGP
jgi:hypothetical protein